MKIALVHDWFVTNTGAEKVLKEIIELYPDAEIFSLVDFLSDEDRYAIMGKREVHTSFIQRLPFAKKHFRNYLPLFTLAIESFNLEKYDLIISSSWAVAKGVKKREDQLHVSYCHTPVRYAWDLYDEYISSLSGIKKLLVQATLYRLRKWDISSLERVDYFIANSQFVQERIKRIYKRDAHVIYPPIDTQSFTCKQEKQEYYLSASRLVSYKKTRLIVEAFNTMPEKKLFVIGSGEEYLPIKKIANKNIQLLGYQSDKELIQYMQNAKAFIYAAVEDFGIVPIEAMACGTPVVALNDGGTAETVLDSINGIHFQKQNLEDIVKAVYRFEQNDFDACAISKQTNKYSSERFQDEMKAFIDKLIHN